MPDPASLPVGSAADTDSHVHPAPTIADCPACLRAVRRSKLPLDERLALALEEDCFTELDEADVRYVLEAVLPVALRYGARMEPADV